MRIETTTRELYTFDELSPEAKQKAIDAVRANEWYPFDRWYEFIIEDFVEKLKTEGWNLDTTNVYFYGFWSQGDGASFEATLNIGEYLKANKLTEKYPLITKYEDEFSIRGATHNNSYANHYSHEKTRYFEIETDWLNSAHGEEVLGSIENVKILENEIETLQKFIEKDRYDTCLELYRSLSKEYDHITSDEYIAEDLKNNDFEFTINGKKV